VILNFIVASQKFLFKDPNRLHTEEYLERRRALDIAESKGKGPEILTEDSQNLVAPPTVKKTLPLTDDIGKGDSTNV
jgi:hypothetical protein